MTQLKIAVLGGDQRYLTCIEQLKRYAKVYLVGYDVIYKEQNLLLQCVPFEELDALILPIAGLSQDYEVAAIYSNERIYLDESYFLRLKKGAQIFTGVASKLLHEITRQSNAQLIEIFKRDDVAIYNAVPTAEGTIMLAIKHMKKMLYQSRVVLLGFGRVGEIVADRFASLGAEVWVGVRKPEAIAKANSLGYHGFHLNDLSAYINTTDLFINTIPKVILTKDELERMNRHQLIIDLASMPGGVDFEFAKKNGLHVIHALGIPGKVAPKTAGDIIAKAIIDEMSHIKIEEG